MKSLEALGKTVAAEQDRAIDDARLVERTAAQLAWPEETEAPSRRPWALALAAVAMLGVAAASVAAWRASRPVTLTTQGVGVDSWVSSAEEQPLEFSDGATVLAAKGSRFKVARLDARGARVSLERGSLSVSVPHTERTQWAFDVGPFVVHVVGTRFDTGWDPSTESFSLSMHDGAVRVEGPGVEKHFVAGQQVTLSLRPAVAEPQASPVGIDEPEPMAVEPTAPKVTPKPRPAPSVWRSLAQQRQYAEAFEAAKAVGWTQLCATASMNDVVLLGDVARLSSAPPFAKEAYKQARTRFPKSRGADVATFFLGRLAFDAGEVAEADAWFRSYQADFPKGTFAAEALGRRLELAKRGADAGRTRQLASDYLERYPTGPHSRLAKSVLGVE